MTCAPKGTDILMMLFAFPLNYQEIIVLNSTYTAFKIT